VPKKPTKKSGATVTPMKFIGDLWASRISMSLAAAIDLDVFTIINEGKRSAADIAKAAHASQRHMQRLLEALVGAGYLMKKGSQFGLSAIASTFLVRGKPTFMGTFAEESALTLPSWMRLAEVIRTGKAVVAVDTAQGREFFPKLVKAIFPLTYGGARGLVASFSKAKLHKIESVLDVAAGSGAWSLPFAQANPQLRVTAQDYPEVIPTTRQYAQQYGVADQYSYLEGDLRQTDFGQKLYDVVLLGHIIHSEGEKWGRALIAKSYKALKPGGTLVIAEMIPNDSRTGPVLPLLFGLNMIVNTTEGDVYTMAEYKHWLKQAGFKSVKTVQVDAPSPLILATR
jgi:3-hydroxy-5-methyl-1-naphthoate 3-O-methyltransferase